MAVAGFLEAGFLEASFLAASTAAHGREREQAGFLAGHQLLGGLLDVARTVGYWD